MRHKSGNILLITLLAAMQTVCSCSKIEHHAKKMQREEMLLLATTEAAAKAPVEGTALPQEYTVYLSAYVSESVEEENIGEYFKSVPFNSNGSGTWKCSPSKYWPLGSSVDLLAVACNGAEFNLPGNIRYNIYNCAKGAEITVNGCPDTEIMYSSARKLSNGSSEIPMEFKHSQAWLQFNINSSEEFVVSYLKIPDIYKEGKICISRCDAVTDELEADWSFEEYSTSVAEIGESATPALQESFNTLVPCQEQRDILLCIRFIKDGLPSAAMEYTIKPSEKSWYRGKKYTYNISITPVKITSTVTVDGWALYNHAETSL